MVGEGVLLECLQHPAVTEVLAISRKPGLRSHPKLREIVHPDFFQFASLASQLTGYDACFYCLGISSLSVSPQEYQRITLDLTMTVAHVLINQNPDITFCYVTGAGTDTSEQGRSTWARVKGATENKLMRLFRHSYMFRPGFIRATGGQKNLPALYRALGWIYPIGRALYPAGFCTATEIGRAMIHAVCRGYPKQVLEVRDIVELATLDCDTGTARL